MRAGTLDVLNGVGNLGKKNLRTPMLTHLRRIWKNFIPTIAMCAIKSASNFKFSATVVFSPNQDAAFGILAVEMICRH